MLHPIANYEHFICKPHTIFCSVMEGSCGLTDLWEGRLKPMSGLWKVLGKQQNEG